MSDDPQNISLRVIEDEMKEAYMAYAMSVIIGRALPDARDGLKPVHRRILYAMHAAGMRHNQPFKKSARIVGDTLGKFHPHGDTAVYDALVRMVQDFSLRYPLIKGQGNFGSVDGDPPAAMRYSEARLAKISQKMLDDIDKEAVDWTDNFDGSLKEPVVLPAMLPNLLINGSSGIAVGMATNMPPHNLKEVCDAILAFIKNPDITVVELMQYLPGPDFPTGGVICGRSGIKSAYATGRGRIKVRGVISREETKRGLKLIISEIPYQVVKSSLVEQIADAVRDKRIEGIRDIRDESDRTGMRVVIELKHDANPDVVENGLFKYTRLQQTFGIINLAIINKRPKVLSLPDLLNSYINHRKEVIRRRTEFDLEKAQNRAHLLEGLLIALDHLDPVIKLIKAADNVSDAKKQLVSQYDLSELQAQAILDMKLQKLTGLEQQAIRDEHKKLIDQITDLKNILETPERVKRIIIDEVTSLKEEYGDDRRTKITDAADDIDVEDLIDEEDMVVTISHKGYIKRLPVDTYQSQHRGGSGIIGATTKNDDFVEHLFVASTHSYLLFFTSSGKVHWKKVYRIPETSRTARGTHVVNCIDITSNDRISAVIAVKDFSENAYLLFSTAKGYVKKTSLKDYSRPRAGGIRAIALDENDDLVSVRMTTGDNQVMLCSAAGQSIRFAETDVRPMGRVSRGVRGMRLRKDDFVVAMVPVVDGGLLLTVTEHGYGKCTSFSEYPLQRRGGIGVRNIKTTSRNGFVVSARAVSASDDILLISQNGIIIRTPVKEISVIGRNTQGVRIMKLRDNDKVAAVAKIID